MRGMSAHSRRRAFYRYLRGSEWRRVERLAKERDGYRCRLCGCEEVGRLVGRFMGVVGEWCGVRVEDVWTVCRGCFAAARRRGVENGRLRDRRVMRMVKRAVELGEVKGVDGNGKPIREVLAKKRT